MQDILLFLASSRESYTNSPSYYKQDPNDVVQKQSLPVNDPVKDRAEEGLSCPHGRDDPNINSTQMREINRHHLRSGNAKKDAATNKKEDQVHFLEITAHYEVLGVPH